jgi:hypothetical protein
MVNSVRRFARRRLNKNKPPIGMVAENLLPDLGDVLALQELELDDIVAVERRDAQIIVSIAGRYWLDHRRDSRGERRMFTCRAISISSRAVALAAPVCGKLGERVIAHIDHIGKLQGVITHLINGGFVMSIIAGVDDRERLVARIEWFEKYKNHDVSERRGDERFPQTKAVARLILPDGSLQHCVVLDLSVSGAGIAADSVPAVGATVTVGVVRARVVRHFKGGFGVQFVDRQSPGTVASLIVLE